MEAVLSHNSALEYWRTHRDVKANDAAKLRRKSVPTSHPDTSAFREALPSGLSYPVSLLVGRQKARWKSKTVRPRVYSGQTPDWSFVYIGEGLSVSSPPFCFFQMAGELPLIKLIELGLEFCGTYSLPLMDMYESGIEGAEANDQTTYNHPPLTSTNALKTFVKRMEGVNGQKKALRALRYITDGSGSPMETKLYMLLTLSHKLGGYGLPMPKLNKRIDPGKAARHRLQGKGKPYYKCDLFWPETNLAVEYDSKTYHTNEERIMEDAKRRRELDAIGIGVETVTGSQILSATEFEIVARQIARKLCKQLRYWNPQNKKKQRELRRQLLGLTGATGLDNES